MGLLEVRYEWNSTLPRNVWMINRLKLHLNGKKLKGTVSMNIKWNVQNNTGGNNHNLPRYFKLFFYRIPNPLKGYLILSTNTLWLRTNILFLSCPTFSHYRYTTAFWSCRAVRIFISATLILFDQSFHKTDFL